MLEKMNFKIREQLNIENSLQLAFNRMFKDKKIEISERKNLEKVFINLLKESIKEAGEYFDPDEFVRILSVKIENNPSISEEQKNLLRESLLQKKEGETGESLVDDLQLTVRDIFRYLPEKKGINFRDKIEDPQELRVLLFLSQGIDEFKSEFERGISQKEKYYFRLWPPELRFRPGLKSGELFEEAKSYIEDIQKGKNKITFYFEEDLLPNEFKKEDGKPDEEKLKQAGIVRKGKVYEFYLTPDKLANALNRLIGIHLEITKGEIEINKLFIETKNLYNDLVRDAPQDLKNVLVQYGGLIKSLEERYRDMVETGASEEELMTIKDNLDKIKKGLEDLESDIYQYKQEKEPGILKKIQKKTFDFLKNVGGSILMAAGFWGMALGWFLPLWLIVKMEKTIDEYIKKQ